MRNDKVVRDGNKTSQYVLANPKQWLLSMLVSKIKIISIFLFIVFCNSSCNEVQNYLNPNLATDTLRIEKDYNPEFIIADPKKIIEYKIKYLSIDNCSQPNSCYHDRYEFNECGKIKNHIPPMVSSSWHFEYDNQCRMISEYSKGFTKTEITYFKQDSIIISHYSDDNNIKDPYPYRYKCKLSPPHSKSIYPKDGEFKRIDRFGDMARPCGEFFEGPHIKITNYYDYGLISTVQYYNEEGNLIFEEDYQYLDSLNNPIKFETINTR